MWVYLKAETKSHDEKYLKDQNFLKKSLGNLKEKFDIMKRGISYVYDLIASVYVFFCV